MLKDRNRKLPPIGRYSMATNRNGLKEAYLKRKASVLIWLFIFAIVIGAPTIEMWLGVGN